MKKILSDLWYNYAMDGCSEIDNQNERDAMNRLVRIDDFLRSSLDDEQKSRLEELCSLLDEVNAISVEKAFESGIRFATLYLLEILGR